MPHSEFNASRRNTIFNSETGKLYVFSSGWINVMIAWPPMAWKKTRSNPSWVHFRPEVSIPHRPLGDLITRLEAPVEENGQLLLPSFLPRNASARRVELSWVKWYDTIPVDVREVVSKFENRQWHLMSLIARCNAAAVDLSIANPALAYALASNWVFHRPTVHRPMRSARALLQRGKKQRDILVWLGYPGTEAARKLLCKVTPESISIPSLLYIRQSLSDDAMSNALSHLPRLNAGAIRIATDPNLLPFASSTLIEEISRRREEDKRPKAAYILQDSLNMFRLLFPNRAVPRPIRSLSNLAEFHDTLVDDYSHARSMNIDISFPRPPMKGTEDIVPITSARELIEEGRWVYSRKASGQMLKSSSQEA